MNQTTIFNEMELMHYLAFLTNYFLRNPSYKGVLRYELTDSAGKKSFTIQPAEVEHHVPDTGPNAILVGIVEYPVPIPARIFIQAKEIDIWHHMINFLISKLILKTSKSACR